MEPCECTGSHRRRSWTTKARSFELMQCVQQSRDTYVSRHCERCTSSRPREHPEAEVCDDGATRIVVHVVDPIAVAKVKNQVYRGFSIGGRVTQREAGNSKVITGLVLNEISLVDRPANPEAYL